MNRSARPNLDTGNESRRWLALLAILLAPSLALVERARAEEWSFVGARYQGMGGAGVAVVDDEQASYWNPGALAFTKSYGVALPVGAYASAEGSALSDIDRVSEYLDDLSNGELDQLLDDLAAGNDLNGQQLGTALRLGAQELPGLDESGKGVMAGIDASLLLRYGQFALSGIGVSHFAADPVFDRENLSISDLTGDEAVDALVNPATAISRYDPGEEPALVAQLEALFLSAGSGAPNLQAEEVVYQAEQAGVDVRNSGVAQNIVAIATDTINTPDATFADNRSGTFVRGLAIEQVGFGYGHPLLQNRIGIGGNLKYMKRVRECCLVTPFTRQWISRSSGERLSAVTIHGPIGQVPSRLFPLNHWPPWRRCRSRQLTSFTTV